MAHFLVTFRIEADSTYNERYTSLLDRVTAIKTSQAVWDETSAVLVFEAHGTAQSVCNDLFVNSEVNSTKDKLVVLAMDDREVATVGLAYEILLKAYLGF